MGLWTAWYWGEASGLVSVQHRRIAPITGPRVHSRLVRGYHKGSAPTGRKRQALPASHAWSHLEMAPAKIRGRRLQTGLGRAPSGRIIGPSQAEKKLVESLPKAD